MLDYNQTKDLIKEIDSSSLRVFELEDSDIKLKLSKNNTTNCINETINDIQQEDLVKSLNNVNNNTIMSDRNDNIPIIDENVTIVKSPLVGTYYSSSTPGGTPYVEVGTTVKKGDVLCIIEAMKIMNEIIAEVDGKIIEVLREDEDIVEFGMELFKIV